jgi:hypothetical protein
VIQVRRRGSKFMCELRNITRRRLSVGINYTSREIASYEGKIARRCTQMIE